MWRGLVRHAARARAAREAGATAEGQTETTATFEWGGAARGRLKNMFRRPRRRSAMWGGRGVGHHTALGL